MTRQRTWEIDLDHLQAHEAAVDQDRGAHVGWQARVVHGHPTDTGEWRGREELEQVTRLKLEWFGAGAGPGSRAP